MYAYPKPDGDRPDVPSAGLAAPTEPSASSLGDEDGSSSAPPSALAADEAAKTKTVDEPPSVDPVAPTAPPASSLGADDDSSSSSSSSNSETSSDDEAPIIIPEPTVYIAPKPRVSWGKWLNRITDRILFPPILLWDLLKLGANYFFGELLGKQVLEASHAAELSRLTKAVNNNKDIPAGEKQKEIERRAREYGWLSRVRHADTTLKYLQKVKTRTDIEAERYTVNVHDGAKLDTVEIRAVPSKPDVKPIYIINFCGNGECYEEYLEQLEADALALQCNVIGFNFRDVVHSRGVPKPSPKKDKKDETYGPRSAKELYSDVFAQVSRLVDQGVDPKNIYFKGHSLGAAVSTVAAKRLHRNGIEVNDFNGRSLSSITNFMVGWIRITHLDDNRREKPIYKVLTWLAKPFIKFFLKLTQWEIEAADAFKALPKSNREYMVVRSSKADREQNKRSDDGVVAHYASIHAALKDERKEEKECLKEFITVSEKTNVEKFQPIIQSKILKGNEAFKAAVNKLHERKMIIEDGHYHAHCVTLDHLRDRYKGNDANRFFRAFVQRTAAYHEEERRAILAKSASPVA